MAVNIYNIRKWYKMLTGKSILHVNQGIGKCYSVDEVKGYYNDLTEKVTRVPELLESVELPKLKTEKDETIEFPTAIFQYGLGAYDLFLQNKDEQYLKKVKQCAEWALSKQEADGAWNNFYYIYPDHPFCAMAQGEGASLLVRAYLAFGEQSYLDAAQKALDFMLKDISDGGVSRYDNGELILMEYSHCSPVMNGWIFALWGLADYLKVDTNAQFEAAYRKTVATLVKKMDQFKYPFWSKYDISGKIASPFYHHLHIAQMQAMYDLTKEKCFKSYADKWAKQERNVFCKGTAFIIKAFQKIFEKE